MGPRAGERSLEGHLRERKTFPCQLRSQNPLDAPDKTGRKRHLKSACTVTAASRFKPSWADGDPLLSPPALHHSSRLPWAGWEVGVEGAAAIPLPGSLGTPSLSYKEPLLWCAGQARC